MAIKNVANVLRHLGHRLDIDFVAQEDDAGVVKIKWLAQTAKPTDQEIIDAEPAAIAAQAAEEEAKAQDVVERQELKAAAAAIKTDIKTILSNANAYIASPATTNAQANAQLLQLTKDLKSLTQAFAVLSTVVKGLV